MSELANFLPTIGAPPSTGGGGSFNTATISVTGTANAGDHIFIAADGSVHPEPSLRPYNHLVNRVSNAYTTSLALALSRQANTRYNYLPLDPNAHFSVYYPSWIGSSSQVTPSITDYHGTEMYSCKMSGGSWFIITGYGREADSVVGSHYQSGSYSVNIISSDGSQLLNSTLFSNASLNSSYGSGGYNKIMGIVSAGSNTVKVYNWTLDWSGQMAYLTVTLFTWNGTSVTKGSPTTISTGWSTQSIPPIITNPVITYSGNTYMLACYNATSLMLVNVATNSSTICNFGATRFTAGQTLNAVIAGTSVHVYQQGFSSYGNISVIDLVTNTAKTSGLATHLTTNTEGLSGLIVKLDATTYCYQKYGNNTLVTVRTSADGFTTVTTTTTALTSGILGATTASGVTYLRTASGLSSSAGKASAQGSLVLQKLQYNSGTASCSLTPVTDKAEALFDLQDGLAIQGSTTNTATELLQCKFIVPLATDTGRATSNQGSLVLQVFSPYHFQKYPPTLVGKAMTTGSEITVLLDNAVQSLDGAAQGVAVQDGIVGVAPGKAIRLQRATQFILQASQIASQANGDRESIATPTHSHGSYMPLEYLPHGSLIGLGSVGGTRHRFTYREVSSKGTQRVVTFFACNGRVESSGSASYSSTTTFSGYSYSKYFDAQYSWPVVLGSTVTGSYSDSPSPNNINGYLREDYI